MRLPGSTVFIHAHKHCVMMFCILVQRVLFCKMCDNFRRNKALLYEVSIHTMHIFIGFRQVEFLYLFLLHSRFRRTVGNGSNTSSQQLVHGSLKIHAIEISHELDGTAADLILVIEPSCTVNHNAVVFPTAVIINQLVFSPNFL